MNVKELKQKLDLYPDDMDVFLAERQTEFSYGLLNSVRKEIINCKETPDGKVLAKETVIILDEE